MIITIMGDLGSGKTSVGKILKKMTNYKFLSTGTIQREIADKYKMTTLELNQYSESHPEIDQEIDSVFKSLRFTNEKLIIDSRMAWHFIPNSFKVYLRLDNKTAAQRIMHDLHRKNEPDCTKMEDMIKNLIDRKASEVRRFKKIYGVDCTDLNNFDKVINTAGLRPNEVANLIYNHTRPLGFSPKENARP